RPPRRPAPPAPPAAPALWPFLPPQINAGRAHTIRYPQRAGPPPRLYVPAPARGVLMDPTVALVVTEGEKKALKGNQEGLPSVAVGGLWSWQSQGRPIPDLDRIDWVDRETVIAPDSDVWIRPDLLQPVFALGKELEERGARVVVLKLPASGDGGKAGLDTYLCTHTRDELEALPRLPLKHAALGRASAWWRGWSKRKEGAASTGAEATAL